MIAPVPHALSCSSRNLGGTRARCIDIHVLVPTCIEFQLQSLRTRCDGSILSRTHPTDCALTFYVQNGGPKAPKRCETCSCHQFREQCLMTILEMRPELETHTHVLTVWEKPTELARGPRTRSETIINASSPHHWTNTIYASLSFIKLRWDCCGGQRKSVTVLKIK